MSTWMTSSLEVKKVGYHKRISKMATSKPEMNGKNTNFWPKMVFKIKISKAFRQFTYRIYEHYVKGTEKSKNTKPEVVSNAVVLA